MYESIIREKTKKYDKTVLLANAKLETIEIFISEALIDPYINRDEFVSLNNVLRGYNEMKEQIKE